VVDAAGRQARLSSGLVAEFAAVGLELQPLTCSQLVAEVSVEQRTGRRAVVAPDRPLLWLSPGDLDRSRTSAGRFLASETLTAARSIATLTNAPVLNRPTAVGPCGAFPGRQTLAVRRAGSGATRVRAEQFTGTRPTVTASTDLEVYDYGAALSTYGFEDAAGGPFRTRAAIRAATLAKVHVVGERTIGARHVSRAVLGESTRIVASYDLDAGTVWWLIDAADEGATLARVDCWWWDVAMRDEEHEVDAVAAAVAGWMDVRLHGDGPTR
ncbi:MAG: hypothetical protein JWM12_3343, partial [Ilumatobacteraceae bacterium]|nr:hypothetical protein [Ilumatobacteraceae bacterium]